MSLVAFGYLIDVSTSGGYNYRIESDFTIADGTVVRTAHPEHVSGQGVADALVGLVGQTIVRSGISAGELSLEFGNDVRITAHTSRDYQAWEVSLPGTPSLIVCEPGGRIDEY